MQRPTRENTKAEITENSGRNKEEANPLRTLLTMDKTFEITASWKQRRKVSTSEDSDLNKEGSGIDTRNPIKTKIQPKAI